MRGENGPSIIPTQRVRRGGTCYQEGGHGPVLPPVGGTAVLKEKPAQGVHRFVVRVQPVVGASVATVWSHGVRLHRLLEDAAGSADVRSFPSRQGAAPYNDEEDAGEDAVVLDIRGVVLVATRQRHGPRSQGGFSRLQPAPHVEEVLGAGQVGLG